MIILPINSKYHANMPTNYLGWLRKNTLKQQRRRRRRRRQRQQQQQQQQQ